MKLLHLNLLLALYFSLLSLSKTLQEKLILRRVY